MSFFVFYLNFYIKSVYNIINYSFISVLFFVSASDIDVAPLESILFSIDIIIIQNIATYEKCQVF